MVGRTTEGAERSVKFVLIGDFVPEDITRDTGVTPARTSTAGELVSDASDFRRPHSTWELKSVVDDSTPLNDQVRQVLAVIGSQWQKFVDLGRQYQAAIQVAVYMYEAQGPELYFDKELVGTVAELSAYIDLDLYCLVTAEDRT